MRASWIPLAGEKVPRRVIRRFDRALRLIDRVATSSGDKTRRLLRRERRVLLQAAAMATRAAKAKKHHITADCAAVLRAAAEQI
jgi:hypothetical protein